jgi:Kef-type K+ transport system membrane component KefB
MPDIVYEIINLLASLVRFLGMVLLGVGLGWLALDLLRKSQAWQLQIAVYLGLVGLVVALANFTAWGALGAFCAGVGVAILIWGLPKKEKVKEKKD